jgi:hypothetical protein
MTTSDHDDDDDTTKTWADVFQDLDQWDAVDTFADCETLPSTTAPHTLTRLGVELVRGRQETEGEEHDSTTNKSAAVSDEVRSCEGIGDGGVVSCRCGRSSNCTSSPLRS